MKPVIKRGKACRKPLVTALAALCVTVWALELQAFAAPRNRAQKGQEAHPKSGRKPAGKKRKCPVSPAGIRWRFKPIATESTPFAGSKVYRPKGKGKHLSLVLLHGSEGGSAGFTDEEAKFLAHQGYPALAFCYFDCGRKGGAYGATLKEVEVTKVLEAVEWMRQQPFSNGKVVVYGVSRGADLALITGSLDEARRLPDALVAHAPSDAYKGAYNSAWIDRRCWVCRKDHCLSKQPSPDSDLSWNSECGPYDPNQIDSSQSSWLLQGARVPIDTPIPVEKISGPILITTGEKDELVPPDHTRRIEGILRKAGKKPEVHYFPGAGHVFEDESDTRCSSALLVDFLHRLDKPSTPASAPRPGGQQKEREPVRPVESSATPAN